MALTIVLQDSPEDEVKETISAFYDAIIDDRPEDAYEICSSSTKIELSRIFEETKEQLFESLFTFKTMVSYKIISVDITNNKALVAMEVVHLGKAREGEDQEYIWQWGRYVPCRVSQANENLVKKDTGWKVTYFEDEKNENN
jgi:hypothetical protein